MEFAHDGRVASHTCDLAASKRWICAELRDLPPRRRSAQFSSHAAAPRPLPRWRRLLLVCALPLTAAADIASLCATTLDELEAKAAALGHYPSSPGDAATAKELMDRLVSAMRSSTSAHGERYWHHAGDCAHPEPGERDRLKALVARLREVVHSSPARPFEPRYGPEQPKDGLYKTEL